MYICQPPTPSATRLMTRAAMPIQSIPPSWQPHPPGAIGLGKHVYNSLFLGVATCHLSFSGPTSVLLPARPAMSQYAGLISTAKQRRAWRSAAVIVVPEPTKGSTAKSTGGLRRRLTKLPSCLTTGIDPDRIRSWGLRYRFRRTRCARWWGDEISFNYERKIQPMPELGPWVEEFERQLEANAKKARRDRRALLCAQPRSRRHAPDMAARARERAQAIPAPCRRPQSESPDAQTDRRRHPREAVAGGYGCICVLIAPAGAVLVAQMVLIVSEDGETAFVALCFAVE